MRQFLRGQFGLTHFSLQQFTGDAEAPPGEPAVLRLRHFIKNVGRMMNR